MNDTIQITQHRRLNEALRSTRFVGFLTIFLFFGVLGGWASYVPLAQGTMASGSVSPDGSRRIVQHLEGGIIQALHVRDGQKVHEGDVLVVLEDIQARSMFATYQAQLWAYLAERSRLRTEWKGLEDIVFSPQLMKQSRNKIVHEAMAGQREIFQSRTATLANQREILGQKIKQLAKQIEGLTLENDSIDRQNDLIEEEIADVEALFDKGLARKPRLLSLQRIQAELAGTRARNVSGIARGEEAIGETKLEMVRLEADRRDETNAQLADLQAKIIEAEHNLDATRDVLERTVIRAPVNGTVINLKFTTVHGVVGAGESIMDIVPDREKLVINARIPPLDIDVVRAGLGANVFLSAYPRRTTPTIPAQVEWVSADIQMEENSDQKYYSARVVVGVDALAQLPQDVVLYPGMPTEVMIKTGERTAIDYLMEPLLSAWDRSFTES